MRSTDQGNTIAQVIERGRVIEISDGSYKSNKGTAACMLEDIKNVD